MKDIALKPESKKINLSRLFRIQEFMLPARHNLDEGGSKVEG